MCVLTTPYTISEEEEEVRSRLCFTEVEDVSELCSNGSSTSGLVDFENFVFFREAVSKVK